MANAAASPSRRRLIKVIAAAVAAPLGGAVSNGAAEATETVSESDPAAIALKYKADAAKAPERKDATAFCNNCNYYTGKPGAPNGTCAVLGNRLVAAKGWCTAWEGY